MDAPSVRYVKTSALVLKRWWMPFLWVSLSPLATVPLHLTLLPDRLSPEAIGVPDIGEECGSLELARNCFEYSDVSSTLLAFVLPGMMNLAPFLWAVSSKDGLTRHAGRIAGCFGLARLLMPPLMLVVFWFLIAGEHVTGADGAEYFRSEPSIWTLGYPDFYFWVFLGSSVLWAAHFIVWQRVADRAGLHSLFGTPPSN
jgi:hypothetical protein